MNKEKIKTKQLMVRNSTAEFLIFTNQAGQDGIDVLVRDKNIWLSQKLLSRLYNVERSVITKHLINIYDEGELDKGATCAKFAQVEIEGQREITRQIEFYNLEAIISVGYRVNSERAKEFRQWATRVLKQFTTHGWVLDKQRLINGALLDDQYYEDLLEELQEIRTSERRFYQKITDIYATSLDYNPDSENTKNFYATVQNKLHFAITHKTAAELIYTRADAEKEHMGLTTWKKAPTGKIVKSDVSVAKNYLEVSELAGLNRIVEMYVLYAIDQAERKVPMTMKDWEERLNAFLQFNERDLLENLGKVSAEVAKSFAESEFEKYKPIQDKLFESDFDKFLLDFDKKQIKKDKK
ncbi:MAG: virulence RhuM family protein [Firmicutes bacterium]|nr:virulence RhuM family protein [Bacillota bacterium]